MPRRLTAAAWAAEDMQIMRNLTAGYEAALSDVRALMDEPGFDLSLWINARLALVRSQL